MQDVIYQFRVAIARLQTPVTNIYLSQAFSITFAGSHSHFVSVLHDCLSGVVGR